MLDQVYKTQGGRDFALDLDKEDEVRFVETGTGHVGPWRPLTGIGLIAAITDAELSNYARESVEA